MHRKHLSALLGLGTLTLTVNLNTGVFGDSSALFQVSQPQRLTYDELKQAAQPKPLAPSLTAKIDSLLNTPFIYRNANSLNDNISFVADNKPGSPVVLRAAAWNIERGFNLSNIISVLKPTPIVTAESVPLQDNDSDTADEQTDSDSSTSATATTVFDITPSLSSPEDSSAVAVAPGVHQAGVQKSEAVPSTKEKSLKLAQTEQKQWLEKSSVLLLTEVDYGMKRTGYKNVTLELAKALNMNAAFGVEFIELSPFTHYKLTHPNETRAAVNAPHSEADARKNPKDKLGANATQLIGEDGQVSPEQYKGLHGLAILSKYPILNARILRLPVCYDWFKGEQEKLSQLEKVRRVGSETIFLEDVLTELRRGSRIALIVDLKVPQAPEETVTFVATHLENRTVPKCRCDQMTFLLNHLKGIHHPVVIGGDWNTSGTDVSPTSVPKEVRQRIKDPSFWTLTTLKLLNPFTAAVSYGLNVTGYLKNLYNPVALNIPLILPNKEKALFNTLKAFRFADGQGFVTEGDEARSYNGKTGFLSDSNQLGFKGYVPTFSLERPLFNGLVGRYKLDWFAVKPDAGKVVTPQNGRTLVELNTMYGKKISDHMPITVDFGVYRKDGAYKYTGLILGL